MLGAKALPAYVRAPGTVASAGPAGESEVGVIADAGSGLGADGGLASDSEGSTFTR